MSTKLMRSDRTIVELEEGFLLSHGEKLGFVKASDGVWVPKCDLLQYEDGRRKPIKKVSDCLFEWHLNIDDSIVTEEVLSLEFDYQFECRIHVTEEAFVRLAGSANKTFPNFGCAGSRVTVNAKVGKINYVAVFDRQEVIDRGWFVAVAEPVAVAVEEAF